MVAPLTDEKRAKELAKLMHGYLANDMGLELKKFSAKDARLEAFGAFMGLLRASNPVFEQKQALRALKVRCPLAQRFPTVHCGKLAHYDDIHVALREVVDTQEHDMSHNKMWRLLVWIFLGNGGHEHKAWHRLKTMPCTLRYKPGVVQPLEVLRWVSTAVCHTGAVMRVIGSDGLDKKSRSAKARFLYLVHWHREVPRLVEAFHTSPGTFHAALCSLPGLRGELSRKELLIILGASKNPKMRSVGRASLPFGQGAKNGAMTFMGIKMFTGKAATEYYHDRLSRKCKRLSKTIGKLFPKLPAKMKSVELGDIEPCLCGAFIYAKQVERLRADERWKPGRAEDSWAAVAALPVPAGFLPYGRDGKPERRLGSKTPKTPKISYKEIHIANAPKGKLSRQKLFREWGLTGKWPEAARPKRVRKEGTLKKELNLDVVEVLPRV